MLEYLVPVVGSFFGGGLVGWLAAVAIKSAAKTLGCLLAILFVLLQVVAYYGIVHWNWVEFLDQARPLGKLAAGTFPDLVKLLTYNIPFTVGGLMGFIVGFRRR